MDVGRGGAGEGRLLPLSAQVPDSAYRRGNEGLRRFLRHRGDDPSLLLDGGVGPYALLVRERGQVHCRRIADDAETLEGIRELFFSPGAFYALLDARDAERPVAHGASFAVDLALVMDGGRRELPFSIGRYALEPSVVDLTRLRSRARVRSWPEGLATSLREIADPREADDVITRQDPGRFALRVVDTAGPGERLLVLSEVTDIGTALGAVACSETAFVRLDDLRSRRPVALDISVSADPPLR